ncbi:bifunctional deaminase-reductase domain-containing protein [Mycobacterium tuberculosis]|nr:bifunctional deaminase-reductase domain-containing protein [Mycobacterium tuberculosis]
MGKIVISENVSLDGVMQDPTGEEGFKRGNWFDLAGDEDRRAWAELELEEARAASALLLGRRSDAWFAERWTSRTGEWADRLNALPKYVVSSTLQEAEWSNGTVLKGEVPDEVAKLKQEVDGDIVVYASAPLVQSLMEHDLFDELRLTVYPVVLGVGGRLFGETADMKPLRLMEARTLGTGLAHLTYQPA